MNTNALAQAASRAIESGTRLGLILPREAKGKKIRITNQGTEPCPLGDVLRRNPDGTTLAGFDPLEVLVWLVQRGNLRMERDPLRINLDGQGHPVLSGQAVPDLSEFDAAAPPPGPPPCGICGSVQRWAEQSGKQYAVCTYNPAHYVPPWKELP